MQEFQTNSAWPLHVDLGAAATPSRAHTDQLASLLREAIQSGRLAEGSAVPPSRSLAAQLGVSRWVVTEAYGRLVGEGYLTARTGAGTKVAPRANETGGIRHSPPPEPPAIYDLSPGLPDLRAFPRARWATAVSDAATSAVAHDFGVPSPHGHQQLRDTLHRYLRRVRGASVRQHDLTVCSSVTEGIGRICYVLRRMNIHDVAIEDPGWSRIRRLVLNQGMRLHPIPTDDEGLDVQRLRASPARAVIVTAAHQFPTGVVLSKARRDDLVRWAREVDGFVVEDDYDAEYWYDQRPAAVLQGSAQDRVFLVGSVSKTLSPALGLGWLVSPPATTDPLRVAHAHSLAPPVLDQLALAAFIERGWYDNHLRAMRRRLRSRRGLLTATLTSLLPGSSTYGSAAGLHLLLSLPAVTDVRRTITNAASAGLRLTDLQQYSVFCDRGPGLVLGFGNVGDRGIERAVDILRSSLA